MMSLKIIAALIGPMVIPEVQCQKAADLRPLIQVLYYIFSIQQLAGSSQNLLWAGVCTYTSYTVSFFYTGMRTSWEAA